MGTEIDLDALVERYADIKAKISPNESIYTTPIHNSSQIGFYFLIDISLSSDSWIEGKRILDVARESLIVFSESLDFLSIPFGIGAFYSRTRNHCRFIQVKKIQDSWNSTKNRLGAIQPIGYTRIGPALRHAKSILSKSNIEKKWIILITDAKPNDYDRYEGKYGIEDVNQAVKECTNLGISIHSLAIGSNEKPSIPAMFRLASYQMLMHPNRLIDSLNDFFRRVIST
jgi:nitric oxide reductase NorD protein